MIEIVETQKFRTGVHIIGGLAFILIIAALYAAFLYAPTEKSMGDVQRIFYFHVPSAIMAFLAFFVVFLSSIIYLGTKERKWDIIALSSAELGVIFCSLVLITGPIWAKPSWGVWWTWDARLTSTLVLWLIYIAYLMLRAYGGDYSQSTRFAAILGIIGFLDVPLIHLSVRWWRTLHPQPVVGSGLEPPMLKTFLLSLLAFTLLYIFLLAKRVSLELAKDEIERLKEIVGG